jgi:uncharacterized protein (TIGR03435 family)
MQAMADLALLHEYATRHSEAAFAELVARRIGFVYSAALRQVRDPHLAEEITQAVFIILAQKAGRISDKTILAGWLFKTTRYTAIAQARDRAKRSLRTATIEKEFQMQTEIQSAAPDALWEQMSPLLDEALATLGEADRQAVLLRFFENKSLAEVGSHLGTGEDTARKRVSRALEKLHRYFSKRGVSSTTAILAMAISANSVQAAPAALAKSVAAVAIAKGAAASGSTLTLIKGALKLMAWTKAKITVVTIVGVLLAAGTTTVVVHRIKGQESDLPDSEKSWRYANISSDTVGKLPPEVEILPTKFPKSGNLAAVAPGVDKFVGIGQSVANIVWAAYNWPQARTIFANPEPTDRYDFITTLAHGGREALQQELKNKLGLVGRHETRDMDVLLLKVRNANAPGLHPPTQEGYSYLNHNGDQVEIKWANESLSKMGEFLESASKMPIIDQTGMTKRYSIDIKWEEPDAQDSEHRALQRVLLDQLGLELVPANMPIEILIVEKVK